MKKRESTPLQKVQRSRFQSKGTIASSLARLTMLIDEPELADGEKAMLRWTVGLLKKLSNSHDLKSFTQFGLNIPKKTLEYYINNHKIDEVEVDRIISERSDERTTRKKNGRDKISSDGES